MVLLTFGALPGKMLFYEEDFRIPHSGDHLRESKKVADRGTAGERHGAATK
jgi:hypothetical protein